MQSAPIIDIQHLSKNFFLDTVRVPGLVDVSVAIAANRFTVLSGPSGSGKTTLLNMIGCIDKPDSGKIVIAGQDIGQLSDDALSDFRATDLGFVFQTFNLLPVLSAYENIEYPLLMAKMPAPRRQARVNELLDMVGLAGKGAHRPGQLSGGQRQRVAIARALALAPKVVLADEPTANLDSRTGEAIIDLMRRMQREHKVSFVFSSHDSRVLEAADDIIHISDGRIVATHSPGGSPRQTEPEVAV